MRPVLFHCPRREDDGGVFFQEYFEFRIGKFSQEDSGWFHGCEEIGFSSTLRLRAAMGEPKQGSSFDAIR
jgi:hypothetical protein